MTDYSELKHLAGACGSHNWRFLSEKLTEYGIRDDHGYIAFLPVGHPAKYGACPAREAKARFLGAMTPATVLALIADADQSEQDYKDVVGTIELRDIEISRLKTENAGLKTGYEAYEQVVQGLKAEIEALKKRVADMSPFRGAPLTGPDNKCLACGGYHYGLQGLPCPKMLITASAAMSKGEQA